MKKLSDYQSWYLLLLLTLAGALIAETTRPEGTLMLLVCLTVAIKGQVVIDNLMRLRDCHPGIIKPMRCYFYVMTVLIATAMLFPQQLASLTTL